MISQLAVERIPETVRSAMGEEEPARFIGQYCMYPDQPGNREAQPYLMPGDDGRAHNMRLHIPGTREQNHSVVVFYVPRVVAALRAGEMQEAMRWFGPLAHFLQDSTCPAHVRYGDVSLPEGAPPLLSLEFFTRFLPEHPQHSGAFLHSVIDGGGVTLSALREAVGDYRPRLLGDNEARFVFHLAERHETVLTAAARRLLPMLTAHFEEDPAAFASHGVQTAALGVELTADALYTALVLGLGMISAEDRDALPQAVSLADLTPAGGTEFTWDRMNYQGRPMRNASGSFGWASAPPQLRSVPLKLATPDGTLREFTAGWGVSVHTEYRFLLTPGAYGEFHAWVGNHAVIGLEGVTEYAVLLDGILVAQTGLLQGADPAVELRAPLGQAKLLTLRTRGQGSSSLSHGVWADPVLTHLRVLPMQPSTKGSYDEQASRTNDRSLPDTTGWMRVADGSGRSGAGPADNLHMGRR